MNNDHTPRLSIFKKAAVTQVFFCHVLVFVPWSCLRLCLLFLSSLWLQRWMKMRYNPNPKRYALILLLTLLLTLTLTLTLTLYPNPIP
jgi:hypothetical protein